MTSSCDHPPITIPTRAESLQKEISKRFDTFTHSTFGGMESSHFTKSRREHAEYAAQQRLSGNMERFFLSQAREMLHS
ncbi:hypothetical protein AMC87_CH00749 [Rhizobium phaseoli]|nr:hypothetical protein AMC87_CH00749 [Rhizobium phaseoli]